MPAGPLTKRALAARPRPAAGFTTDRSTALSNGTIMAGSVTNFLLNLSKTRGGRGGPRVPLIDWDLVAVFMPTITLGVVAGSYLHKLLPELVITILLMLLLHELPLMLHHQQGNHRGTMLN